MLLPAGFAPYAHAPLPEAPVSPKLHLNATSCVTLFAAAESVVAVASKNAKSGDIPLALTTFALSCKLPLVVEHDAPAVGAPELTETVTLRLVLPPAPVHVSVYVELLDSAPVLCDPLMGSVPDHAPEAVQEVALVTDQVNVELAPLATLVGLALNEMVGSAEETVTVAD
jgi:hypothetical protein